VAGEVGEVAHAPADVLRPAGDVFGGGEVVALGAVAAVGEHEVLDGIVRPP
jgi:hypothetical protein